MLFYCVASVSIFPWYFILFVRFIKLTPTHLDSKCRNHPWGFSGSPGAVAIIEPSVSISTLLLALISMMTTGIHEVDSFCVLGSLKKILFPQRQCNKGHSVFWGPVWSPVCLCLWHFSFKPASAVCSVSFTRGRRSAVHLILSISLGSLKEIMCSNRRCPFPMDWKLSAWS